MRRLTSLLTFAVALAICSNALAQYESTGPFNFLCYSELDSSLGPPILSLDEDTVGVLVIIARGWGDCFGQGNDPLPSWANRLFDQNDDESLTRFFDDNSRGAVHLTGVVAHPPAPSQDSCFYTRHIPCHRVWSCDCLSGGAGCGNENNGTCQSWPNCPAGCEYDSMFQDICSQVDAAYDLSQFDLTGDNGVPDGIVDFVLFINYPHGNQGLGALYNAPYNSPTDDVSISRGVTFWGGTNYYQVLSLAAHEVGHSMGHTTPYTPDWGHGALQEYNHNGIGGFDVMCSGGFGYADSVGYPSLFNPWSRNGLGWSEIDTIDVSSFDLTLQPYCNPQLNYASQGTSYRLGSSIDPNQYFLITAHNRLSLWERFWPTEGLLAWRVNTNGWSFNYSGRSNRVLQIESASGDWNWNIVGSQSGLSVAVRTDTANAESGFDSLDFRYTRRNGENSFMFDADAGYLGWGGVGQLFRPGLSMEDHSNPTSRLRINSSPLYPRSLNSGTALRNIRESVDHVFTADLIVNSWQGLMTQSHTWFDSIYVSDYLMVDAGATLTIESGTTVYLEENVEIVIESGAKLIVEGTEEDPVIFQAKDWGEKWSEILINGGALDMNHARIYDSRDACIYTNSPYEQGNNTPVRIRNTYMHGGDLTANAPALRLWGSPSYTQQVTSCVIDSVPTGVGMYLYNCYVDFDADTVRNCSVVNSYIKKVSGSFRDCVFKDRTSNYGVLFNSATCNPNITCSKFLNLAPPSGSFTTTVFAATGCSPTFAGTTAEYGRSNVIEDTSAYLLIVEGTGVKPTIVKNDWLQRSATGRFMEWRSYPGVPVAYDVDDQYWSSTPTTAMFTPSNAAYWDWTPYQGSGYDLCGEGEGGGGSIVAPGGEIARGEGSLDDPTYEELLLQAIDFESNEDFQSARSAFQSLVFSGSSSAIRWRAMLGCVTTDVRCATPASWITTYMDSLRAVEGSSYEANVLRGRLHYSYLLNNAQYLDAIAECASLLNVGLEFVDSINVAIDLLGIQMAAGLIDDDGLDCTPEAGQLG